MSKVAAKIRKLRKADPAARHVRFYRWELESGAYRSLSLYARCLLTELKAIYNGTNNGDLFLSVREATNRLGTGMHQAIAAFHQLEDRGFIKPRQRGAFQWKERHATCWVLTEYQDDFSGQAATKDFMKWRPETESKNKSRLPLRQQTVAAPAADGRANADSAAAPAADSTHFGRFAAAAPATQIVYQGEGARRRAPHGAAAKLRWHAPAYVELTRAEYNGQPNTPSTPSARAAKTAAPSKTAKAPRKLQHNSGTAWPMPERRVLGLTQYTLAERIGVTRGYIASIEQGRITPGPEICARIEAALQAARNAV